MIGAKNFDGTRFAGKATSFERPTQLPRDEEEAERWQAANQAWWETAPMRYDWHENIGHEPGTEEYFVEIDRRFFSSVWHYMPWLRQPFDSLIDFGTLADLDVLEIGVGMGTHAQLIAPHCNSYNGIDLTRFATEMTVTRMRRFEFNGIIQQMDAERMDFRDESFDFIWTWGVIHHSANTCRVLSEMARVLRPGGTAVVMVYYRSPWKYYVADGIFKGVIRGDLLLLKSLHRVGQAATDGAIARHYSTTEWRDVCSRCFEIEQIAVTGLKTDVLPLPAGRTKEFLLRTVPDSTTRFFTNRLRFGTFLISKLRKRTDE